MFNLTSLVTSPASTNSIAAALYEGVDMTSLNWFELQWVKWYLMIGDPAIGTGLLAFIMHELVYFGRCIPWIIIDAIPYFRRWKLQPNKVPTLKAQWECTKYVLFTHFTVELPQIWLFHPLAEHLGLKTYHVPFPSWRTMVPQILCFFVLEDIWHYFAHQALHYGPMYKHIHKLHHKYSAPFGLAAEYAHPLEVIILGMGTIGGPLLYCYLTENLHFITVYIWVTLRLFQAVDAHSGYDFPWSFRKFIPFWAGADHHDFHHMAFVNNYATSFRWMDFLFGTDTKYRAYKQRVARANVSERQALEQKIFEETEKEGLRSAEETEMQGDVWTLAGKGKIKVGGGKEE